MMLQEWANKLMLVETEKRRLELIRYLLASARYEASASLLRLHMTRIGVPSTLDQVKGALQWLEEQGLITVRTAQEEIVARITSAGREVADGSRSVPGVLRPDP